MKSKPPGKDSSYSFQTPELAALAIDVWCRDHQLTQKENTLWQTSQDRWNKGIVALSVWSGSIGWLDTDKHANHINNLGELRQLLWPKPKTLTLGNGTQSTIYLNEEMPKVVLTQDLNHIALTKTQIEKLYEATKDL